jgi:hypothetical protein
MSGRSAITYEAMSSRSATTHEQPLSCYTQVATQPLHMSGHAGITDSGCSCTVGEQSGQSGVGRQNGQAGGAEQVSGTRVLKSSPATLKDRQLDWDRTTVQPDHGCGCLVYRWVRLQIAKLRNISRTTKNWSRPVATLLNVL